MVFKLDLICLLRRLFLPAIDLYFFTSAMLSFCHFNIKEKDESCQQNSLPATITATSLHRRWVAADTLGWFNKHFLVIVGRNFPFYPNTKQQFGRKQSPSKQVGTFLTSVKSKYVYKEQWIKGLLLPYQMRRN